MLISSSGMLMDALRQHHLLSADQLTDLPQIAQGRSGNARLLAKHLCQKGLLSVYQVNQLLAGKAQELVIGPYHVLDKLGQGGLSSVYKARRGPRLDADGGNEPLVAIKMIKAEVFATSEGRQQFLQEVEAMARLDHPNIVQFCDADQWRDTFYFAMEYVEGTDLGKVIRLCGALPVHEACDYIRQSALGLQHAYERNLIHRDIKPVNLFLTHVCAKDEGARMNDEKGGGNSSSFTPHPSYLKTTMLMKPLIKILDWGLASLRNPKGLADDGDEIAAKSIVGTADYLSPEQACNANAVDIRADIYSLGCSLYYLLTAQAPFADGTLMQKIMQHQTAEPKPIEEFRTDVPAGVTAIIRRMMAKKPEERYQTPASVGMALLPFARRSALNASSGCTLPTLRGLLPEKGRDDTPIPPTLAGKGKSGHQQGDENACEKAK